ncbi:MAG: hypothetical protein V1664_04370 [Candidatus Uhrbacteria bacterium]
MLFNRPRRRRNFFRQAQVAPYRARRFQNPFFQSKNKHPKWPFIVAGIVFGLSIALISFFFTAPIFKITSVRVEGVETFKPKNIRDLTESYLTSPAWLIFNHRNRFLFEASILKTKLEKEMSFSALEIKREGQTLAIIIKEKISVGLWQTNDLAYLLDESGTAIRSVSPEETDGLLHPPLLQGPMLNNQPMPEPGQVLIFKDLENKSVAIGQALLSTTEIQNIRTFFTGLRDNGIYLESFELNRSVGSWFKAVASPGYAILFDPTTDIQPQINNFLLVFSQQIKDPSKLEYIDVRFGNNVYYK